MYRCTIECNANITYCLTLIIIYLSYVNDDLDTGQRQTTDVFYLYLISFYLILGLVVFVIKSFIRLLDVEGLDNIDNK